MIKRLFKKILKKTIYPTNNTNWYAKKGYVGENDQQIFQSFIKAQRNKSGVFYKAFENLQLRRQFITSREAQLDSVLIKPNNDIAKGKTGQNHFFILFQGRKEPYEKRFRDMAILAKETGASVLGFNPKGFHSSTGKIKNLDDIVNDGIAIVNYLLSQNIHPSKIILLGNSLGAGIQELVCKHFRKEKSYDFKQINSNSFKTIAAVFACNYNMPTLEKTLHKFLLYIGWDFDFEKSYYQTGINRFYLRRKDDRTIYEKAEYKIMVDEIADYNNCPEYYKETNKWLNNHSQLIYTGKETNKDPHIMSLHFFKTVKISEDRKPYSPYDLINRFLISGKNQ
ncbi:MAG: hypothetical protein HRU35_04515 [Rickettsiaceae bacterium]|nr:hypothetical protein [Rickettsiaceae bacterium]